MYYPLRATKGTYREPPGTVFLSVIIDDEGKYIHGAGAGMEGDPVPYPTPGAVIDWFLSLKSKTWIITYNLDFIPALIEPLIDHYSVSGYGEDTRIITLTGPDQELYIIDAFIFLLEPLFKLTGHYNDDNDPAGTVRDIRLVWDRFRYYLRDLYGVHPSKAPGATALKTWRPYMPRAIKKRGDPITKFSSYGVTSGALHWKNGYYPQAYLYDINAAYPYSMAINKYPIRSFAFHDREPGPRFIATVNLDYVSFVEFSPLAVRLNDNAIVHPAIAEGVRAVITHYDKFILEQFGDLKINQWIEGVEWRPEDEEYLFLDWVRDLEQYILNYPESKPYLKVVSRALHSKFAQKAGAPIVTIQKVRARDVLKDPEKIQDLYPLANGDLAAKILTRKRPKFQAYIRPDWEVLTLSFGRYLLYSRMDDNTIYMDTDCIISTEPRPDLDQGPEFGKWKLDKEGRAYIAGPRMYVLDGKPKAAGIRAGSKDELVKALIKATEGISTILQSMERVNLAFPVELERYRGHTITKIKYPFVTVLGTTAYITRSPTEPHKLKYIGRILR